MEFCLSCGASRPPKDGEGTCAICDPKGVRVHELELEVETLSEEVRYLKEQNTQLREALWKIGEYDY